MLKPLGWACSALLGGCNSGWACGSVVFGGAQPRQEGALRSLDDEDCLGLPQHQTRALRRSELDMFERLLLRCPSSRVSTGGRETLEPAEAGLASALGKSPVDGDWSVGAMAIALYLSPLAAAVPSSAQTSPLSLAPAQPHLCVRTIAPEIQLQGKADLASHRHSGSPWLTTTRPPPACRRLPSRFRYARLQAPLVSKINSFCRTVTATQPPTTLVHHQPNLQRLQSRPAILALHQSVVTVTEP